MKKALYVYSLLLAFGLITSVCIGSDQDEELAEGLASTDTRINLGNVKAGREEASRLQEKELKKHKTSGPFGKEIIVSYSESEDGALHNAKMRKTERKDIEEVGKIAAKDPVNNEMDRLELLRTLQDTMSETRKNVRSLEKESDTRVMVIGTTGAGKSTLVHQLVGCEVTAQELMQKERFRLCIKPDHLISSFEVGHGRRSCTTNPNSYHDKKNKLVWWDCPGFLDSKGVIQELANQLAVSELFTGDKLSKILLVSHVAAFDEGKGQPVWNAVEAIVTMFGTDTMNKEGLQISEKLKNNLVFVVTHAPDGFNVRDQLNDLVIAPPNEASPMARALIRSLSKEEGNSFTSYMPLEEGVVNLTEGEEILRALTTTLGTSLKSNQASVRENHGQCAKAVGQQISSEISSLFANYIQSITLKVTTEETSLDDLNSFIEFFNRVKEIGLADNSKFLDELELIGRSSPPLLPTLEKVIINIKKIREIQPFLVKFGVSPLEISQTWNDLDRQATELLKSQIKFVEAEHEAAEAAKKYEAELSRQQEDNLRQKVEHDKIMEDRDLDAKAREEALERLRNEVESSKKQAEENEARLNKAEKNRKLQIDKLKKEFEGKRKRADELRQKESEKEFKRLQGIITKAEQKIADEQKKQKIANTKREADLIKQQRKNDELVKALDDSKKQADLIQAGEKAATQQQFDELLKTIKNLQARSIQTGNVIHTLTKDLENERENSKKTNEKHQRELDDLKTRSSSTTSSATSTSRAGPASTVGAGIDVLLGYGWLW